MGKFLYYLLSFLLVWLSYILPDKANISDPFYVVLLQATLLSFAFHIIAASYLQVEQTNPAGKQVHSHISFIHDTHWFGLLIIFKESTIIIQVDPLLLGVGITCNIATRYAQIVLWPISILYSGIMKEEELIPTPSPMEDEKD